MRPLSLPLQVDLDMLNVSLGTGTLEVHSALLNTQYLDAQLVCVLTLAQTISSPLTAQRLRGDIDASCQAENGKSFLSASS